MLAAELAGLGEPFVLAGDGARRYRTILGAVSGATPVGETLAYPPPGVLAWLALRKVSAGEFNPPSTVLPHYLRDAETRIKWETRARAGVER